MLRLLTFLLLAAPVWADPPQAKELSPAPKVEPPPNAPISIEPNKYRWFAVEGYTGPVTWQTVGTSVGMKEVDKPLTLFGVVSGQVDPGEYPVPAGALIVWGKAEGTTVAAAWGVVDGKAKQLLVLSFLVGPAPPEPAPKPKPEPVGSKSFWVVTVEDMTIRTPATTAILGDVKWWDGIKPNHEWRNYGHTTTNGMIYAAKAASKGINLPAVLLFDKTKSGLVEPDAVAPLTSKQAVLDLIKANGGK